MQPTPDMIKAAKRALVDDEAVYVMLKFVLPKTTQAKLDSIACDVTELDITMASELVLMTREQVDRCVSSVGLANLTWRAIIALRVAHDQLRA